MEAGSAVDNEELSRIQFESLMKVVQDFVYDAKVALGYNYVDIE